MSGAGLDLGPTFACGLDWCCENCGASTDDLDVETALVPVGVYCLNPVPCLRRGRRATGARKLVPGRQSRL